MTMQILIPLLGALIGLGLYLWGGRLSQPGLLLFAVSALVFLLPFAGKAVHLP